MNFVSILATLATVGIIILLTWLVARFTSLVVGRVMSGGKPSVTAQARKIGWIVVWAIGLILAIEQLDVRSDILLLVVGLIGIGIIVALRIPFENIGGRYFSDIYIPFKVGDSIIVKEYSGKVVEVNSMSTILLSNTNELISIPNSYLLHEVVVNASPQAWKEVIIPISIGNTVDLAAFETEVLRATNKLKLHLDKRFPPVLTTKSGGAQSTDLVLTVMVQNPEDREQVTGDINKRIAEILQKMQEKPNTKSEK